MPRKTALITGASSGIGAAISRTLAMQNFRVITSSRAPPLHDKHITEHWLKLDVTSATDIDTLYSRVGDIVGNDGLQVLINSAGFATVGPLEAVGATGLSKHMEVNVYGPVRVTNSLLPLLRAGNGKIINIGSISGRWTLPFMGAYSASKMALRAISRAQRLELMPWNIPVTLLEVGNVRTPIWSKTINQAYLDITNPIWKPYEIYARRALILAEKTMSRANSEEAVCKAVCKVITSKNPAPTILIGNDALFRVILISLLPARAIDAMLAFAFRLKK